MIIMIYLSAYIYGSLSQCDVFSFSLIFSKTTAMCRLSFVDSNT